ncbi:MAG: 16S rRNA (uracil(1498)-N(3))-methyltransferase [Bacteroidota bacterium]
MYVFYEPNIQTNIVSLSEEESRHCVKVLRKKAGDSVYLTDGKGKLFEGTLADNNIRGCVINITSVREEYNKRNYYLHIAIAPTKSHDRFEFFLEKATEIGINEITPIICARSERKTLNMSRSERIIESAMKQSVCTYKPILNEPVHFNEFIRKTGDSATYIAHCMEGSKTGIQDILPSGNNTIIAIGPEGDFSPEETEAALTNGFTGLDLGKQRLRTETAGIIVCNSFALLAVKNTL